MNAIKKLILKVMASSLKVKLGSVLAVAVIGGGITTGVVYHNQNNASPQKQVSNVVKENVTSEGNDKKETVSTNTPDKSTENVDSNKEQTSTTTNTAADTTKTNDAKASNEGSKNNSSSSDSNKADKNASTATSASQSKNTNTSTSTNANTNTSTSTSTNANTSTSPSKSNTNTNTSSNTSTNSSSNTPTNTKPTQPKRPTEIDWGKTEQANKDAGFYQAYSGVTEVLSNEVKQSGINIFNGGTATKKLIDGITIEVMPGKFFTYKYQGKNIYKVPHKSTYGWGEGMGVVDTGGMTDNYCIVQWDSSINDYVFYYVGMKLN